MNTLAHGLPGGLQARGRCWPGSLALRVGQLPVVRTPWVALNGAFNNKRENTTESTKKKVVLVLVRVRVVGVVVVECLNILKE